MPLENPSFVFGEDCAPSLIVKRSTAADHTVLKCGLGEKPAGVAHEGSREAPIPGVSALAAASGESARVYGPGESCEVVVGSTVVITAGQPVMADASSQATPAIHNFWALGNAEKTVTGPARARVFIEPHVVNRSKEVVVKTADYTVDVTDLGKTLLNTGASGAVTFALPAAIPGYEVFAHVVAAQSLRLDPNGSETIALPSTGVQGAAGKYLGSSTAGATVHLKCSVAGTWDVLGYTDTWAAEA
jgi:hypothetical protein